MLNRYLKTKFMNICSQIMNKSRNRERKGHLKAKKEDQEPENGYISHNDTYRITQETQNHTLFSALV